MRVSRFPRAAAALVAALAIVDPLAGFAQDTVPGAAAPATIGVASPATDAPRNASPVYGDLTHLTFTATGPLHAALIAPADGAYSRALSPMFEVSTVAGAGVELKVNGSVVPFAKIGRRTVNNKTGETHYYYFGVTLEEGANAIVLTPLGAGSLRGEAVAGTVYGPGRAVRLNTSIAGALVADGRTPVQVRVAGFDRHGRPAAAGTIVKLTIVRGDGRFVGSRRDRVVSAVDALPSAAPAGDTNATTDIAVPQDGSTPFPLDSPGIGLASPGPQIGDAQNFHAVGNTDNNLQTVSIALGDDGTASVPLIPGLQPGDLRLRTQSDNMVSDTQAYVNAKLRRPMVLGLATTGVGSVPGVPGELATQANGANARRGRIAIYGVGQVSKTAQVQVAYDTADTLQSTAQYGGNVDNPQERLYQTYGDASSRRDDALSRDHLYARIDSKHSSAMWGEFQANTGGASGDGFSQLVAGAKVEVAGNNARLSAFNARNDVAYARQVFSPTGLATIGALLHPNIVIGSDTLSVVTLDRRTGAILAQTVLSRNVDYTIDYGTGSIRFINPPLPFDLNFNPQQILAEYEYDGPGVSAQTTGGRFETGIGGSQAVRIGAGYVNDSTGAGNYALLGQDVSGKLSGGGWTIAHQQSSGSLASINTNAFSAAPVGAPSFGNAYRATFSDAIGFNHFSANFDATSPGFSNPFGGLSTAGLLDYRVAYQRLIGKSSADSVMISFDHEQNNVAGGISSTSNAALLVQAHVTKRLAVRGGVNVINSSGTSVTTDGALANQVSAVPTPVAATTVLSNVTRGTGSTTQIDLGAQYKVAPQVGVAVDRITSLSGAEQQSQPSQTTAELSLDLPHNGRAYVRQLWADAPVQSFASATSSLTSVARSTRSTAVGLEQSVGSNTTVQSEYSIENTGNGSDVYSSIGGREHFNLGANLHGDLQIQHASSLGAGTGSFNLYGLSLAYATASRFRATTNYQLRTGSTPGYTLDVGAAGALSDNVSSFASSQVSSTGGYNNVDDRISIAYRPAKNDRAVTLFGFQALDGNVSALGEHTQLLSLEELYRPDRMLEIAGRYAYKLDGDNYYPAHSSLFGLRITQRIGRRFDVAGETRFLAAHDVAGASTTGLAIEAGYRIGAEMRVAAGYNFSGSPDPSLALAPTRRGLYATATSVIDRIFGWGKEDL